MKFKNISALSLLLCLSLTACGMEKNELPEINSSISDSQQSSTTIDSSSQSSSSQSSSSSSESSNLPIESTDPVVIANYSNILNNTILKEYDYFKERSFLYTSNVKEVKHNYILNGESVEDKVASNDNTRFSLNHDFKNNRFDFIYDSNRTSEYGNSYEHLNKAFFKENNINYMYNKFASSRSDSYDLLHIVSPDHEARDEDLYANNYDAFQLKFNNIFNNGNGIDYDTIITVENYSKMIEDFLNPFFGSILEEEVKAIKDKDLYKLSLHKYNKDKFKCNFYGDEQLVELDNVNISISIDFTEDEISSFDFNFNVEADPMEMEQGPNESYKSLLSMSHEFTMSHKPNDDLKFTGDLSEIVKDKQAENKVYEKLGTVYLSTPLVDLSNPEEYHTVDIKNYRPTKLEQSLPDDIMDLNKANIQHISVDIVDYGTGKPIADQKSVSYDSYYYIDFKFEGDFTLIIYKDNEDNLTYQEVDVSQNPIFELPKNCQSINNQSYTDSTIKLLKNDVYLIKLN